MDLKRIKSMEWDEYKTLIVSLLKKMGYAVVQKEKTADGGICVIADLVVKSAPGRHVVLCRRYPSPVSESLIDGLCAIMKERKAAGGVFITASSFTPTAKVFAKKKPVVLVDGEALLGMIVQYLDGDAGSIRGVIRKGHKRQ